WGALHDINLCINHAWSHLVHRLFPAPILPQPVAKALAWSVTFLAVIVGWVFFRASSFEAASAMLQGMAGLNGVAIPNTIAARLGEHWHTLSQLGVTAYLGGGSQFTHTWLW